MITTSLLLALSFAQDGWNDTHRVVLRNGNFVDGVIESLEADLVVMKYSPTGKIFLSISEIQKDDQGRPIIQEIHIRHANEEAKIIAPPTPSPSAGPDLRDPLVSPEPTTSPKATSPEPEIDPALKMRLDLVIRKMGGMGDDEFAHLKQEAAAAGAKVAPWLAWRVETLDAARTIAVIEVLKEFPERAVLGILIGLLDSPRPEARASSARVLGARGDSEALESISPLLRDAVPQVRIAAIGALGQLGDAETVTMLVAACQDPVADVRTPAIGTTMSVAKRTHREAALAKAWLDAAGSGRDEIRCDLLLGLSTLASNKAGDHDFPSSEVRTLFLQELSDTGDRIRASAALAIGVFHTPDVAEALLARLPAESNPDVLANVISSLGQSGMSSVVPHLIRQLESGKAPKVKAAAALALRQLTKQSFGEDAAKWTEWYGKAAK